MYDSIGSANSSFVMVKFDHQSLYICLTTVLGLTLTLVSKAVSFLRAIMSLLISLEISVSS